MGREIFVLLLENRNNLFFINTGVGDGLVCLFKGKKLTLASNCSFNLFILANQYSGFKMGFLNKSQ
ncbi:hypothetical protein I79_011596 [Cricetulus griseus]|uniref:Uncharacterized protein n=1 Tax=Cricetulus griseus TaxID=10029 RepID=G3HLK7_CRIGR|nr:hypothetical protein I79_011596 [Cricetulus griseus]